MKFLKRLIFLQCLVLSIGSHAQERVECPKDHHWTFEGYCKKEINKEGKCPQGSKLTRTAVTAPLICMASGRCPSGTSPNATGMCVKPEKKKK